MDDTTAVGGVTKSPAAAGCRSSVVATSGDVDANGDVVDERPAILVALTARLRLRIVSIWIEATP